jgi:hypothetical protein
LSFSTEKRIASSIFFIGSMVHVYNGWLVMLLQFVWHTPSALLMELCAFIRAAKYHMAEQQCRRTT